MEQAKSLAQIVPPRCARRDQSMLHNFASLNQYLFVEVFNRLSFLNPSTIKPFV
jgi:hypothetical protein